MLETDPTNRLHTRHPRTLPKTQKDQPEPITGGLTFNAISAPHRGTLQAISQAQRFEGLIRLDVTPELPISICLMTVRSRPLSAWQPASLRSYSETGDCRTAASNSLARQALDAKCRHSMPARSPALGAAAQNSRVGALALIDVNAPGDYRRGPRGLRALRACSSGQRYPRVMEELFWDSGHTTRYGVGESLYGRRRSRLAAAGGSGDSGAC